MAVVNFSEQLKPGTFEFALNYLIEERLDLSIFDAQYKNDQTGRPAYDPAILLKVILFVYSKAITLSKQIYSHRMSVVELVFGNLTNNKTSHEDAFVETGGGRGFLQKYVLSASLRTEALVELDAMNINAYTLYGSEEGLAEMLSNREYGYRS